MQGEKIYKIMNSVGVWNLVLGIIFIIVGALIGTSMIVNGTRLLKKKSDILF